MSSVNLLRLQKSILIRYATGTRIAFRISIFRFFKIYGLLILLEKFWISKYFENFGRRDLKFRWVNIKMKYKKFYPVRASVMKMYGFAISKSDRSSFSSSTSSIISMISYFSDRPSNRLLLLDECS